MRNVRDLVVPDEHHRPEIDAAEVEKNTLTGLRVTRDLARVPEELVRLQQPADAGERRLKRERHTDLPVPFLRTARRVGDGRDRVIPVAVEARPVLAHHLRPRILAPAVFARHLLAPRGEHRLGLRGHARKHHCQHQHYFFHRLSSPLPVQTSPVFSHISGCRISCLAADFPQWPQLARHQPLYH
ncbi:MAG: hypothetical protein BWY06_02972 [Candidatus Latescibacteria bacterium ADurb.Bin168]|nr:MAG: hypothetical protein BWY06_02972 [Candidatus Latescibacteria bacterium ADurb.Bin168]